MFSIRIRIRILGALISFLEKSKSLNFLNSKSNSNFTGAHVILGKSKSLNFLNSNSNANFAGTHVTLGKKQKFKFSQFEFEFEFCVHPCYFRKKGKV